MLSVVIMGFIAVGFALLSIYVGLFSGRWPQVIGIIFESEIKKRSYNEKSGKCLSCYPSVKYRYEIDSKVYKSDFIGNFLYFGSNEKKAISIVDKYPKNIEVKVYVHPIMKGVSVLSPGLKQPVVHFTLLFLTIVLTIIGFFLR